MKNRSLPHLYSTWASLKQRCSNPNGLYYKYYGGRGITYCPEWKEYKNFYADMGPSWKEGLTLDRIDNDGNYCKENCRWATRLEQAANKSPQRKIQSNNKTQVSGVCYDITNKCWVGIVRHAGETYKKTSKKSKKIVEDFVFQIRLELSKIENL